jgi:hypothetical protein
LAAAISATASMLDPYTELLQDGLTPNVSQEGSSMCYCAGLSYIMLDWCCLGSQS